MKVLIAGGAGYIGSSLVPVLLDRGYEVDVVDLFWFGNHLPSRAGVIHKDIFDISVRDMEPYQQVVFLAGLSNDPMAEYAPSQNFIFNAAAPAYLAYIAKQAGVKRYVYASSCSVYGYTEDELFEEDRPVSSSYPYGISKLQGEQAVLNLKGERFSVIALRKGTVSGYSPRMRLDLIINTMFKSAVRNRQIVVNNPSIWRPIAGLADTVKAYVRAVESSDRVSGIFNIASGNFTVGEVGDAVKGAVEDLLNIDVRLTIKNLQDFRNYKVSTEKAANILSFHASQTVRSIVADLVANMKSFQDWDNPCYYNIDTLKAMTHASRTIRAVA
jgi:nucleoside-diphosphate-sugar epimerase